MPIQIKNKIEKLVEATAACGKVGLLIIESGQEAEQKLDEAESTLSGLRYQKCAGYLEIMDALSAGQEKLFYAEKGEKLDARALEIVAEFEAGIVSLMDGKNHTGLKVARWNPAQLSLILLMTRDQVEESYSRLFEYVNITQSV